MEQRIRSGKKHKCELAYEGKPIEIEFAVMQRKSREEQARIASVTIKWENLVPGLRKVDDYDVLTWVYLECGTCGFIYFDLID